DTDAAGQVNVNVVARALVEPAVEVRRVANDLRRGALRPDRAEKARALTRGLRADRAAVQQQHLAPQLPQMERGRRTEHAAADDEHLGVGGQRPAHAGRNASRAKTRSICCWNASSGSVS